MEGAAILACLHHCGVLERVLALPRERWPLSLTAIANNAAQTARSVRRQVRVREQAASVIAALL